MSKRAGLYWLSMALLLVCGLTIYWWPRPAPAEDIALATLPAPTAAATPASPSPTPVWRFPAGSTLGELAIGGMTEPVAAETLIDWLKPRHAPLTLRSPAGAFIVTMDELGFAVDPAQLVATARAAATADAVRLPLVPDFDPAALESTVAALAPQIALSPTVAFDAEAMVFVLTPGLALDVPASVEVISRHLALGSASRSVDLVTTVITNDLRASPEQVAAAFAAIEEDWGGIIGISATDLNAPTHYAYREDTVFSGMSVIKIAILLQAYISEPEFTEMQQEAIDMMIQISDNRASNALLEMIGDGDALYGVELMNTTLRDVIGLEVTSMAAPFESIEYLLQIGMEVPERGEEGPPPFTDADPYIRSTPLEMATLVRAIVACAANQGPLLDLEDSALTPERCTEMLAELSQVRDTNKIVAGVPRRSFVAHKSGWVDDCRADSGYVRTPDGLEYVVSLWIWDARYIETEESDPLLASLSKVIYTAFEPVLAQSP